MDGELGDMEWMSEEKGTGICSSYDVTHEREAFDRHV